MTKIVLIVDDDAEMLDSLRQGLEGDRETYSVVTAENGRNAINILAKKPISLVVTDLKMPQMDGFELLGYVMEHYPDIPVVVMTGYSTPEMKRMAQKGGAIGYIAKPFLVENLARSIKLALRRQSDGGTLHGVSSGIFLQLIEMEERTCTIRLSEKRHGKTGVLFFKGGELLDARYGSVQGVDAAYEIFSWEEVSISIQNGCRRMVKRIEEDLQAVLLEAMKRTDENAERVESETPSAAGAPPADDAAPQDEDEAALIRRRIASAIGARAGVIDVYPDEKWDPAFSRFDAMARQLGAGGLSLAYTDKGRSSRQILIGGRRPTLVVEVTPECPRDKLLQILDRTTGGSSPQSVTDG